MKRHAKQPVPCLSLIAVTAAALCQPAAAADYIWQGGDGQWLDASRWTLFGIPGAGDTATINFTSTGSVNLHDTRSLDRLTMNGGRLGGNGTLNLGSLVFNGGALGATSFGSGGTINVSGAATFNGNGAQDVALSQRLNLNGNSTWTAGNGRLAVDGAYSAGNASYPSALLRIGTGTTFTDEGAASSNGYKVLGGGDYTVINEGTYQRNGLGTTWARGLDNRGVLNVQSGIFAVESGNWLSTSSGQVNVAQGAELWLANTTFTGGSINNAGKVVVIGNDSHVQAAASISGQWQIDRGRLFVQGQQRIGAFTLNGGDLTGQGTLTVDSLEFNAGTVANPSFLTGLRLDVQGNARLDGSNLLRIETSAQLQLNGNSTWTAGNGKLAVDGAYSAGNASYPSALLRIGTGTTFTDEGAASSNGYKVLGGGDYTVINEGTYQRNGLGTTWARGLDNRGVLNVQSGIFAVESGNWLSTSSGQVNVAQDAELWLANTTFTGGSINNAGKVVVIGNVSHVQAAASISGQWQIDRGRLFVQGQQRIGAFTLNGGDLTGQGTVTVDSLVFNAGKVANPSFLTGLRLEVQGNARLDGSNLLRIETSAQLQLNGNSTWTAGNGRLAVDGAYSAGNASYPSAVLRIGTGTTFTDEGAASSNGYKVLGGGTATVVNNGTYIRSGLGTTEAYGLSNAGLLDLTEGALAVDSTLVNTGTLNIRSGTLLQGLSGSIRNDGLLQGDGTVRTVDLRHALVNAGTLTPGSLGSAGQLQVDGDLTLLGAGALRIDLAADAHDLVSITSDMRLGGTLQIWASPALELHTGDSFVVATYGQRLDGSTFDQVLWLGQGGNPFSLEYGDHALSLRVTAAVPEPSIALMMLLGLGVAVLVVRRRR